MGHESLQAPRLIISACVKVTDRGCGVCSLPAPTAVTLKRCEKVMDEGLRAVRALPAQPQHLMAWVSEVDCFECQKVVVG